jgi:hypothetical protein
MTFTDKIICAFLGAFLWILINAIGAMDVEVAEEW